MPGVEQTLQEDLFTATEGSYLLHACNCMGTWGSGIALAFKSHFPDAFEQYREHCDRPHKEELLGTSYIIETRDYEIVCCFTSLHYGQRRDSEEKILASTKRAAEDLVRQLKERQEESPSLAACKLNAGKFGVEWSKTKAILTNVLCEQAGYDLTIYDR